MSAAAEIAADAPVQHDLVRRALAGKFLVAPHECSDATKGELRRLVLEGKLVFANGGWTVP